MTHTLAGYAFVDDVAVARFAERLPGDLATGAWERRFGHLRTQPEFNGSPRTLVGRP